jgi:4-amino-4-deoxy-L-arabinose transferase-like glycosyltransferase
MQKSAPPLLFFITVLYLGLAVMTAFTMRPVCDEGWFSNPAANLLTTGAMNTTVLDPTASFRGIKLQGIDRHTYWIMPFYILAQAVWYRITGFSLLSLRLFSVMWGLVALLCWYSILKLLLASAPVALLAAALLATDFHFHAAAGDGRMDMMTFALGSAALAAYLSLRERSLSRAVLVSQILAAAALFTHPLGIVSVVGLAFVSLYSDWKRLRLRHAALGAVPYAVAAAAWAAYILQSPSDFFAQFGTNASGRILFLAAPVAALKKEISIRYVDQYGLAPDTPPASRIKIFILATYAAGVLVACTTRSIRNDRAMRTLLVLTAWTTVGVMLLDSFAQPWYIVHLVALPIALLAVSATYLWTSRRVPAAAIVAVLGLAIAIQLLVSGSRAVKKDRRDFLAAVTFLRDRLDGYHLVLASAECGIPLGFDGAWSTTSAWVTTVERGPI